MHYSVLCQQTSLEYLSNVIIIITTVLFHHNIFSTVVTCMFQSSTIYLYIHSYFRFIWGTFVHDLVIHMFSKYYMYICSSTNQHSHFCLIGLSVWKGSWFVQ